MNLAPMNPPTPTAFEAMMNRDSLQSPPLGRRNLQLETCNLQLFRRHDI